MPLLVSFMSKSKEWVLYCDILVKYTRSYFNDTSGFGNLALGWTDMLVQENGVFVCVYCVL